jgi:hypothetical protein
MKAKVKFILIALEAFRSVTDHKTIHSKGNTLETQDVKRVNSLVSRGLAEIVSAEAAIEDDQTPDPAGDAGNAGKAGGNGAEKPTTVSFDGKDYDLQVIKDALVSIGVMFAPNAGVNGLTKKIGELTDDQKAALAEKLSTKE